MNNNTGVTLVDVRTEAIDAIRKLKNKEIDIATANSVKGLLDTIVSVAKTQVEFLKVLPEGVKKQMGESDIKAIAGTLVDRDAELDKSLHDIQVSQNSTYEPPKTKNHDFSSRF
jgi:hypothetical protein